MKKTAKNILNKVLPQSLFLYIMYLWRNNRFIHFYKYNKNKKKITNWKKPIIKELDYSTILTVWNNIKFKIKLYPKSNVGQDNVYYSEGHSGEIEMLSAFCKYLKKDDIALDIGANIGHHSIFISLLVGKNGKIISFEPISEMIKRFEENIKINNIENIILNKFALSDKSGSYNFYINEDKDIGSSSFINYDNNLKKINVETKTLDELKIKNIKLIKIDVEGYEYNVLLGGKETILQNKPIIILEYSPNYYYKNDNSHCVKILKFLFNHGYAVKDLENYINIKEMNIENYLKYLKDNNIDHSELLCVPH